MTNKFKVGDSVTIINRRSPYYLERGEVVEDGAEPYQVKLSDGIKPWLDASALALAGTWEGLTRGDVVVQGREAATVLERIGDLVFSGKLSNPKHAAIDAVYTIQELQDKGYTIKNATPTPDPAIEAAVKLLKENGFKVTGMVKDLI